MIGTANQLATRVGVAPACRALEVPRASFYRRLCPLTASLPQRPTPARALSLPERQSVLDQQHAQRFLDQSPREIYASLLDQGRYLCSIRSMYRLLEQHGELRERREQLCHPPYQKPQLLVTQPNQVWSWDITKLLGPAKWSFFYLYVILDIFSRYVVGWMVATRESASLAQRLIAESCHKQNIGAHQLTVHSDRGPSMTSKSVALLLADLAVTRSLSRPRVSNDNPFSESQFKTLKYRPQFPDRFGSLQDARTFCHQLFDWYKDRKSTRLNSSHIQKSRMPSSA